MPPRHSANTIWSCARLAHRSAPLVEDPSSGAWQQRTWNLSRASWLVSHVALTSFGRIPSAPFSCDWKSSNRKNWPAPCGGRREVWQKWFWLTCVPAGFNAACQRGFKQGHSRASRLTPSRWASRGQGVACTELEVLMWLLIWIWILNG